LSESRRAQHGTVGIDSTETFFEEATLAVAFDFGSSVDHAAIVSALPALEIVPCWPFFDNSYVRAVGVYVRRSTVVFEVLLDVSSSEYFGEQSTQGQFLCVFSRSHERRQPPARPGGLYVE
jgi:hypothetical protein